VLKRAADALAASAFKAQHPAAFCFLREGDTRSAFRVRGGVLGIDRPDGAAAALPAPLEGDQAAVGRPVGHVVELAGIGLRELLLPGSVGADREDGAARVGVVEVAAERDAPGRQFVVAGRGLRGLLGGRLLRVAAARERRADAERSHDQGCAEQLCVLVDFRDLVSSAVASLEDQRELVDWFNFCTRLSEAQRSWA
jgi:hypothetical protein